MGVLTSVIYGMQSGILRKSLLKFWLLLSGSMLTTGMAIPQEKGISPEYQVKAAFLLNFARFVEWPPNAFDNTQLPLVIGVLGKNPFHNYLEEIVSGEHVNGHPLMIQHYTRVEDVKACHILFVDLDGQNQLKSSLEGLNGRSILTVGESPSFIRLGGMVRFFSEHNKIRFQVNPEAAKNSGLIISSKLLRVAEIVVPKT